MPDTELFIRLCNWLEGKTSNPFMITLRPTWKCNLLCKGCNIPPIYNKKPSELTYLDFLSIIEEAAKLEVRRIEIVGEGEPLCKEGIIQIMKKIKYHNMKSTMTTNGTLFTEEKIRDIINMGWDVIAVSLDGPDAKTHDYLRGVKGTFDKVVKNLKMFKKYKEEMERDKPKVLLNPFLNKVNYSLLEEMIILGKKLGVEEVNFKPLVLNENSKELQFNEKQLEELSEYAEEAYKTAKEIEMKTNVEIFINRDIIKSQTDIPQMIQIKRKRKTIFSISCLRPFYHIDISPDGTIFLCHYKLFEKIFKWCNLEKRENIRNTTLKNIWYGSEAKYLRDNVKEGKIPEICNNCCGGNILEDWELKSQLENFISS